MAVNDPGGDASWPAAAVLIVALLVIFGMCVVENGALPWQ